MDIVKAFGFGNTLAFLLPGFVTAAGLSNVFPTLGRVFGNVTHPEQDSLGILVFFVLTSLAAGVAVSALRSISWDLLIQRNKTSGVKTDPLDYTVLRTKSRLEAFNIAVENLYRYYQFTANLGIALLVLLVGRSRFWNGEMAFSWTQVAILLVAGALLAASRQQNLDMEQTLRDILLGMKQSDALREPRK